MSPSEFGFLSELAAVRYLLSDAGQEDLLDTLGPQDRSKVLDQAAIRQRTLEGQLEDLMCEVYVRHGEFFAFISDIDRASPTGHSAAGSGLHERSGPLMAWSRLFALPLFADSERCRSAFRTNVDHDSEVIVPLAK
jgi:hypothetical protein